MKFKEYTLRMCRKEEYEKLVGFIREYWGRNHVFCRNKKIFELQHGQAVNGEYDFVVAVHNETQEFHAVLGFISSSTYDGGDHDEPNFVFGALWKVRDDICKNEIGKLGLGILYYLIRNYPKTDYITLGLSGFSRQIYDSLHFNSGKMIHYYIASKHIKDYIICENPVANSTSGYNDSFRITGIYELPCEWYTSYHPVKNAEYYKNRYVKHPFYHYSLYGIYKDEKLMTVWVTREISVNGHRCLRLIDMIGDVENRFEIEGQIQELLKEHNAEFIDCYNYGLDRRYFTYMGFNEVEGDTVIPNYYEPFEKQNVDIYFAYYSRYPVVIFKGDADQDRPNLLNDEIND